MARSTKIVARSTKMGRPRTFDTDEILEQVVELFWRGGYEATSTRRLEASLGVKQSSLYNAFGSKRDLLDAALDRYEARLDTCLVQPLERAPDGPAAVDRFLVALQEWITTDGHRGCMLINLLAETGDADPAMTGRAAAYRDRVRQALAGALAAFPDATPSNVTQRTEILIAGVLGLNIAARGGSQPAEMNGMCTALRAQVANWAHGPM